jgi:hypothetical protein
MPQPKSPKARRSQVNTQIEESIVDPKELLKLEKSINSRDQAPTVAQSTPDSAAWKKTSTTLAQPYDSDRPPTLAQLRQIRKDPMIAFGLHYIKVPIARANWMIDARDKNGPNAQVSAFIDSALRKIYARYIFQRCQALDFGFKAQVKRFILENPGGIYRESASKEADPAKRIKPVWDEGSINPYIWKAPVGLKAELVTPRFVETGPKAGEFDGLVYEVPASQRTKAQGFASKSSSKDQAGKVIDVYHALWGTNMKDEEDGCQAPDQLVLTTNGYVPIGDLDPESDRLVSYSSSNQKIHRGGPRRDGYEFIKGVRSYSGQMITVDTGVSKLSVTPNHKFTVRWNPDKIDDYVVYLMKKGNWWRIDSTKLHHKKSGYSSYSGLGLRAEKEQADSVWIVGVFESKREALFHESLLANSYNIPGLCFTASESTNNSMSSSDLKRLWDLLNSSSGARELLNDLGLLEKFPVYQSNRGKPGNNNRQSGFNYQWTCHAANLLPELMMIPSDPGSGIKADWRKFSIAKSDYEGEVISLEIEPYHHYISGDMVTQNSIYGYPRIAYAKDYWWDYNFARGQSNRALERLAIPPIIARYPEGSTDMGDGVTQPNWQIALEAAERLRSNSVAAIPSTMQESGMEGISNSPAWDFKFLETPTEALSVFDARFNYLNVMKLRSLWVPEQAFIEGAGGQSSRNVASQMAQIFEASQQLLMEEIVAEINQYMIPQLILLNFPEFFNNGGTAKMISHGFRAEDLDFYKQIIQLIGQADPALMGNIDTDELFDRINVPLKDPRDYEIEQSELATKLATQGPPLVPPTTTTVGTISNPDVAPGGTNGGSVPEPNAIGTVVAGFSNTQPYIYMQPSDTFSTSMMFADSETDNFLASLPGSKHYSDKTIRALTLQMRRVWKAHFKRMYPELAGHVGKIETFMNLSDVVGTAIFEFADDKKPKKITKAQAQKAAKRIMSSFVIGTETLDELRKRSSVILKAMADRASKLDLRKNKNSKTEIEDDAWSEWLSEQTGRLISFTHETMRGEVQPQDISKELSEHYQGFPETKANAIARSETRDAVNAGTLISTAASGLKYVKASDGEDFDEDCRKRNGSIMKVKEAWKEMRKEHTYGTLGFDAVPRAEFSVKAVSAMPEFAPENAGVYFENGSSTAYVLADVPQEDCDQFLMQLSDWLIDQECEKI